MVTVGSENPFPSVLLVEGDPEALVDNPAAGQRRLAVGLDHLLYLVDDAGVATEVGGSSGLSDPMTTRGDIIVRNASNVTARLGRGSASQVLTSDGTDVAWQTPSGGGGGLVLLEQHTASTSASLDFTTCISSTYDVYLVQIVSLVPTTDQLPLLRFSTNGGSTYDSTTNYYTDTQVQAFGSATLTSSNQNGETFIRLYNAAIDNAGTPGLNMSFTLYNPLSASHYKFVSGEGLATNGSGGGTNLYRVGGLWIVTTPVNAFRIFMDSSGTIASGTVRVYGYAK